MSRPRKDIMEIRQILQLKQKGYSNRKIADSLGINRNTVNKYVRYFKRLDKSYEELMLLSSQDLEALYDPPDEQESEQYKLLRSKYSYFRQEMSKTGCTLQQLWYEYKTHNPESYGYTRFCHYYNEWSKKVRASGILNHKLGEKLYMDFAGKKLSYIDAHTGKEVSVEVFVAILPATGYTYMRAVHSQKREDVITCINDCLSYFGGVPQALVSDNLKSAVTKAHRYAPKINKTLKDCALHYNTVIDPARPYKAQDKALVEGAVSLMYQRIYYPLSKGQYFGLKQLNQAILPLLDQHNKTPFQRKELSRYDQFTRYERPYLQPLPTQTYMMRHYKRGKVQKISHVYLSDDKSYYSVPYQYIGKQVALQYNKNVVELYYKHERIATHPRSKGKGQYITNVKHMPSAHQAYSEWSLDYFVKRASHIGPYTTQYIERLILQYSYPEQGYKQAQGILSFKKYYGPDRLEKACQRAMIYSRSQYGTIETILSKGLDQQQDHYTYSSTDTSKPIAEHDNIRGNSYYQ